MGAKKSRVKRITVQQPFFVVRPGGKIWDQLCLIHFRGSRKRLHVCVSVSGMRELRVVRWGNGEEILRRSYGRRRAPLRPRRVRVLLEAPSPTMNTFEIQAR